ncbi:MAG: hypothetical protein CVU89_11145 [Firmicutes bacterium HGW-Firmicutes-14]|nr:MAG: hypothetical protein CVU89_11145 [Firmicutes bacterium HGW-Firmicutes-14]
MRVKKIFLIIALAACLLFPVTARAEDKWQGTDDLVDRKMEELTGVAAREPLIDISQGNLGLFIFAAGGFAAGTLFGYQWRRIFGERRGEKNG